MVNNQANGSIQTFQGDNFNEAMAKAEMKMGNDLKVVETREVTEGGIFGFFGETKVEVDAFAAESSNGSAPAKESSQPSRQQQLQKQIEQLSQNIRSSRDSEKAAVASGASNGSTSVNGTASNGSGASREWSVNEPAMPDFSPRDRARKIIEEKSNELDQPESTTDRKQTYTRPKPGGTSSSRSPLESGSSSSSSLETIMNGSGEKQINRLTEKTDLLAEKVDSLLESGSLTAEPEQSTDFPGELDDLFHRLVAQDMEKRFARDLVARVRKQLEAEDFHDINTIYKELSREIREDFVVPPALQQDGDQPLLVPFIGPTGVGKTTTIAKLAAYYDVEENRDVGFITLDGYRLAAVEQLRRYADILRVPLRDVTETENVSQAIDELIEQGVEMIFIDTAGRSQFDEERIEELQDVFPEELPSKTHLVLSATSRSRDLKAVLSGFDEIGFDRIAMTKLDETRSYGSVYNVMKRSDQPMAYFTDGQEVPDDLWIAEADQVANLIIEGAEK